MKILYQYIIQSQRYYCSEWSYKLRYVLIELFTLVITVLKIGRMIMDVFKTDIEEQITPI